MSTASSTGKKTVRKKTALTPLTNSDQRRLIESGNASGAGPVVLFFRVADEREGVSLANDSPFGLGGSVFTSDVERGKRVARRVNTGMMWINHPTGSAPELPFGGIKRSGFGRELSCLGIQEFVNKKLTEIDAPPASRRTMIWISPRPTSKRFLIRRSRSVPSSSINAMAAPRPLRASRPSRI